ncbi:MAG: SpoIIE family protein phosphatase [Acidobacteria bacterium]|nr:SpoIIE family protein phosphatase [Acidobacteriota bacterium]
MTAPQEPAGRASLASSRGRLFVAALVGIRILAWLVVLALPPGSAANAIDTIGSVSLLVALAILISRLVLIGKRRLLWRVRRKLILSYMFIGVVPALLIAAFFLLCGLLLFFNVSSYLVKSDLRDLAEEARFIAESSTVEVNRAGLENAQSILSRRQQTLSARYPALSLALLATGSPPCAAASAGSADASPHTAERQAEIATIATGPWRHLPPPRSLPMWIACSGFSGIVPYHDSGGEPADGRSASQRDATHLVVRGAALPDVASPRFAIVADIPVDADLRRTIRLRTGISLGDVVEILPEHGSSGTAGRSAEAGRTERTGLGLAPARGEWDSVAFLDSTDWTDGVTATAIAQIRISLAGMYDRLSSTTVRSGGRNVGQLLAVAVLVVGVLFLIIEFVALVMGLALARSITGSVHELFEGTERVRRGDFTHKIPITARDQLGELASSFNSMTASIEELLRQAEEKKRLEEELRIARRIQTSLLPRGQLRVPGLTIHAMCEPAREVGGDYYDFFPLDEHRLGILIADVSGKGTSAAFYMAELKGLMLSLTRIHRSPRQLLIEADRIIAEHLDSRSFITLIYAVLDLDARTLTYCRAGHTPLIYRTSGCSPDARTRVLAPDGLVLGLKLDQGEKFRDLLEESELSLQTGDVLVLYTDGLSEAMNADADCFGDGRLSALVDEHGHLPFDELRERILRDITAFVGDAPQHDDMTMILIRVDEAAGRAETAVGTKEDLLVC